MNDTNLHKIQRLADRFMIFGIGFLFLATSLLIFSVITPVKAEITLSNTKDLKQFHSLSASNQNLQPLLVKMAGVVLIRPAQVQAAVKDTGAAQRLLSKLKLQGVIQMGSNLVAYIQVEKQSVQTVKKGEKIWDFMVDNIEPGKVTLSLEGVVVTLGN